MAGEKKQDLAALLRSMGRSIDRVRGLKSEAAEQQAEELQNACEQLAVAAIRSCSHRQLRAVLSAVAGVSDMVSELRREG